jgi:colanic acid biosynthesis glycosyl transferase WcaI
MNYAPEMAGVGRYTGEIGEYFAGLGHEVRVVTTPPHYPGGGRILGADASNCWNKASVDGALVYWCPFIRIRKCMASDLMVWTTSTLASWRSSIHDVP